MSKTAYHECMFVYTITIANNYNKKVGLQQSLNQHHLLYCHILTLCSKIFKHLVVSPRLVFSMFNTVNRCYCYTGIKFVLPKCHCGTERIRLSTVPTSALHPTCIHATHTHTHIHGEPRTQPRHSSTNKHTKNTNYAYPNTLTP